MYKQFNKELFDNSPVAQQVEVFNRYLKSSDMSVNKLCESLGLEKATISKRFKRNNYKFDNENREYKLYAYVEGTDEVAATKVDTVKDKKETISDTNKIDINIENSSVNEYTKQATNKSKEEVKKRNINKNKDDEVIAYITENKDILKEIIESFKDKEHQETHQATKENTNCIIDLSITKDKEVNRSFRIYKNVSKELTKLQSRYPEFRLQDMVNTALIEYCKKHNK